MDDTADYMEIQSRRNNVRACVHITRPGTETSDHRRESKYTKCPVWIKLAVMLQVCTSMQRHTWRVTALSTMHATTVGANPSRWRNIERDRPERVIKMSLMMNLTLTTMKIALIPRELTRKETFDTILVFRRWKGPLRLHAEVNYTFHIIRSCPWIQSVLVITKSIIIYNMYCIVLLCCRDDRPKRSLNSSRWVKAVCEAPEKARKLRWRWQHLCYLLAYSTNKISNMTDVV